jgi:hypothetical protein
MATESDVRELALSLPQTRGTLVVRDFVRLAAVERDELAELAELVTDAWRVRAPKRLADSLDA